MVVTQSTAVEVQCMQRSRKAHGLIYDERSLSVRVFCGVERNKQALNHCESFSLVRKVEAVPTMPTD